MVVRKIPLQYMPKPRDLVRALVSNGEDHVALLESGPGFPGRARYTVVAWSVDEELIIEWDGDLYGELQRITKGLGDLEHGDVAQGLTQHRS